MCELVKEVLHAAITGGSVFLGAWLAFRNNRRLEIERRKASVIAAIFSVRDQIPRLTGIKNAHASTLNQIRDAIAQAVIFISQAKRDELFAAWAQYRDIPENLLDDSEDAERQRAFAKHLDKLNVKSPREIVGSMLAYIESVIKNA